MRRILVLAIAIALPGFALAQNGNAYTNNDPECAPVFQQRALEAAQRSQEDLARDLEVMDPYYRNIKENPRNDNDQMLSCVDVNWPDLPFSGSFGMNIEEFLASQADRAVSQACRQMRDQYRRAGSTFSTQNLQREALSRIQGSTGYAPPSNTGGGLPPTSNPTPPPTTNPGGIGGLINPRPNPTPPGGGTPIEP